MITDENLLNQTIDKLLKRKQPVNDNSDKSKSNENEKIIVAQTGANNIINNGIFINSGIQQKWFFYSLFISIIVLIVFFSELTLFR